MPYLYHQYFICVAEGAQFASWNTSKCPSKALCWQILLANQRQLLQQTQDSFEPDLADEH